MVRVRLFRPFDVKAFVESMPKTVQSLAVLDRTKEPGSAGEPLYQDVLSALFEMGRANIKVIGGRYGLSSKEFTPAMTKASSTNWQNLNPRIISRLAFKMTLPTPAWR